MSDATGAVPSEDREVLTWPLFGTAVRELAQQVADSGFSPQIILAIARGGLVPGGAIAYALGTKNVATMNVEFYTGIDERLEVPVVLPPVLDAVDIAGARVLVVDDVADTGKTLQLVLDFCSRHVSALRSAVLYTKPRSVVTPDHAWRETSAWIDFPWSAPGTTVEVTSAAAAATGSGRESR